MSFRLVVRDFEIIEKCDLTAQGLVWVVGPNNNGKSSLIRALDACLYNRSGDDFIRDQQPFALVGLDFPEERNFPATRIVWKKLRGEGASYLLDGETYNKIGRVALPDLLSRGFQTLDTQRSSYKLPFWHQFDLFLVNDTPSAVFDVLSRILEDRELLPVHKQIKEDLAATKDEIKRLEAQHEYVTSELQSTIDRMERLQRLDEALPIQERMGQTYEHLQRMDTVRRSLGQVRDALSTASLASGVVSECSRGIEPMRPQLETLMVRGQSLVDAQTSLVAARQRMSAVVTQRGVLEGVQVPDIDGSSLTQLRDTIAVASRLRIARMNRAGAANEVQAVQQELSGLESERTALYAELGGICPLCGHTLEDEHGNH
jgi:DNA repair ATPase RecN